VTFRKACKQKRTCSQIKVDYEETQVQGAHWLQTNMETEITTHSNGCFLHGQQQKVLGETAGQLSHSNKKTIEMTSRV